MPQQLDDRAVLEKLISFDTTSVRSNLELIGWIADYLDGLGIPYRLTHDETRAKANLFATIGPSAEGGVVLSGHTDVVPVDGQVWTSDPFTLTERNGRLHGRGACDMKGFIALALARAPLFQRRARKLPLHYAFTFDEETTCGGIRHLLADLPASGARPRLAIIGEPTGLRVANAHKGVMQYSVAVTGLDGHSSAPERGVNAILAACEVIREIEAIAASRRDDPVAGSPFDPPYTTFNIGTIQGGTAQNIVARECRFTWEFRPLPGEDEDGIERRVRAAIETRILPPMRAVHPEARIEMRREVVVPGLAPEPDGPAERLVRQLTGANASGTVSYGTEAGLFQRAGFSAVVCGPGSIEQAHKPDEFISLEQFAVGGRFLDRLAEWLGAQ